MSPLRIAISACYSDTSVARHGTTIKHPHYRHIIIFAIQHSWLTYYPMRAWRMLILDGTATLGSEKAESRLMSTGTVAAELISEGWSAYTLP
jgi:hypothetical protein